MLGSLSEAANSLVLAGVVDYRNGAALREQGRTLVAGWNGAEVVVDCGGVQKASSVGVSLLLCLQRDAAEHGKRLMVRNLPHDIAQIAEVCGISALMPNA